MLLSVLETSVFLEEKLLERESLGCDWGEEEGARLACCRFLTDLRSCPLTSDPAVPSANAVIATAATAADDEEEEDGAALDFL